MKALERIAEAMDLTDLRGTVHKCIWLELRPAHGRVIAYLEAYEREVKHVMSRWCDKCVAFRDESLCICLDDPCPVEAETAEQDEYWNREGNR